MSTLSSTSTDARSAFNIKVLKRHDPNINEIVYSASFVVLYQYSSQSSSWSKTGIEGPMFLYRREIAPHYGMFVLNRNGVENFAVSLTKDDELQLTDEFVILRTEEETILEEDEDSEETIVGVWVFEKDQRVEVGKAMLDIQGRAEVEDEIAPPSRSESGSGSGQGSISLDALFASSNGAVPQQASTSNAGPAASTSTAGPALLDAIFQSASPTPKAVPAQAATSQDSAHTSSTQTQTTDSSASDLMAMLGLKDNRPKAQPQTGTNGHQAAPVAPAPAAPAAPQPPTQNQERPPFRETAAQLLDEQMAAKSTSTSSSSEPPMAKGEFVREVLSLIHTDKAFTQELYDRYVARTSGQ